MSNHWIAKVGLILATWVLAACNTQSQHQSTHKQPETLQGQILMWAEIPLILTEAQSSRRRKVLNDLIEEFRELYPQVQVFVKFLPSRHRMNQILFSVTMPKPFNKLLWKGN